jgi:predicted ATP-dependent endonuclease of OLD family
MSKANGAQEKKSFLQHVSLKNYKSIKDVEIDFKPGLNIIIGKNASGKTNFINGLNAELNFKYDELLDAESTINASFKGNIVEIRASNRNQAVGYPPQKKLDDFSIYREIKVAINDEQTTLFDARQLTAHLSHQSYYFSELLIKYGILYDDTSKFINVPYSFRLVYGGNVSSELTLINRNDIQTKFIDTFFYRLYKDIYSLYHIENKNDLSDKELKYKIISLSEQYLKTINEFVAKYSPIKAIRLNHDFSVISEENGEKKSIANFYLEFSMDERAWLPFNLLSDGAKRLFCTISEMLASDDNLAQENKVLNIILFEEPELGIHPHQLHQLMQFIKEQSREKQIIITTHSPQVLDVLSPDELDRVIICHYDLKNGTQLSHLTEKEMDKARKYMKEEAFLSDYWRFSDLEPAS